jgi:hypothetical protein
MIFRALIIFFSLIIKDGCSFRSKFFNKQILLLSSSSDIDPNFEAHLPALLKVGSMERPSPDIASDLRKRYKQIVEVKRKAVAELKTSNAELAIEVHRNSNFIMINTNNY